MPSRYRPNLRFAAPRVEMDIRADGCIALAQEGRAIPGGVAGDARREHDLPAFAEDEKGEFP